MVDRNEQNALFVTMSNDLKRTETSFFFADSDGFIHFTSFSGALITQTDDFHADDNRHTN